MKKIFTLVFMSVFVLSCCNDDDKTSSLCDTQAQIIPDEVFDELVTTNYTITNVVLNENCLEVTVSSSGCNPDNWEMFLFSKNTFFDLLPLHRSVKIQLVNNELCEAVFQKTISFDLTPFRLDGQNVVPLNIQGWNEPVNYEY